MDHDSNPSSAHSPDNGILIKATIIGTLAAMLLAWSLLTLALSLPFLLGLFFFMLFGLVIGAVIFRFANVGRPFPRPRVVAATAIVSVICWATAIITEGVEFPSDFVTKAVKKAYIAPDDSALARVEEQLRAFVVKHLSEEYPPGGVIGYLQYAATGQPITVQLENQPRTFTIPPPAPMWSWWTRVMLSVVLLYVAVFAVTTELTESPKEQSGATKDHLSENPLESGAAISTAANRAADRADALTQ